MENRIDHLNEVDISQGLQWETPSLSPEFSFEHAHQEILSLYLP